MSTQQSTVKRVSTEMGKHGLYPRLINLAGVTIPLIGFILAIWLVWGTWLDWIQVGILVVMYVITGLGITIGYHRLFTHRSFATPRWVTAMFAVMGSMAVEGPVMHWVAIHRKHHQYSDDHDDPHSPNTHGGGFVQAIKGMWHAHAGWIIAERKHMDLSSYVYDLKKDKILVWTSKLFFVWVAIGFMIPAVAGGLLTMLIMDGSFWKGALLGLLWGGLARVVLVHHVTWSINSVCHIWGGTPFKSNDDSKNNVIFGVLAMGEGWHNNHHAFPRSAKHGLAWWQFDLSYVIIKAMSWVGLAKKINVPDKETIESRRLVTE